MTSALQIVSLAVICAVAAVLIREKAGSLAAALSLAFCAAALLLSLRFFGPILDFAERLRTLSGLNGSVTSPLLKSAGLGILTQVAGSLCEDAGEKSLAKTVDICGSIFALYVSLPLMNSVLELMEHILGG